MTSQDHLLIDEVAASLAELDGMSELSHSFFEIESAGLRSPPFVRSAEASKARSPQDPELGDPELLPYSVTSSAVYTEVDFDVCGGISPMTSTPVTAVTLTDDHHSPSDSRFGSPKASTSVDNMMTGSAEYAVIGPGRVCSVYEATLFVRKDADKKPLDESMEEASSAQHEEAAAVLTVSVEYATVGPTKVTTSHDSVQSPADHTAGLSASSGDSEPQPAPAQSSETEPQSPPPVTSQPAVTTQPVSITSQPATVTSETPDVSQSPPASSQLSSLSPTPSPILCQPKRGGAVPSSSRSVSWCLDESGNMTKSKSPTRQPGTDGDSTSCLPNGSAAPAPLTEGQKRLGKVMQDLKKAEEGSNGYSLKDMAVTGLSAISGGVKDVARVFSTPFHCCKRRVSRSDCSESSICSFCSFFSLSTCVG